MQSQQWMSGAMDNSLSLHIEGLGFDSCWVRLFFFIVVLFWCVSFLFLNIGSVLQHQFIRKYLNVTFDIKPKKSLNVLPNLRLLLVYINDLNISCTNVDLQWVFCLLNSLQHEQRLATESIKLTLINLNQPKFELDSLR